jgi:phosphoribosylformylglycinamidine synthase
MVYLDPYEGARLVVAEAFANLCATGATPLAVTDCLNFGNPENPEIMWQFAEAVRGLGDACRLLKTPVVSGNVSLYNETDGVAIKPTPMIAMVGLLDDVRNTVCSAFPKPGLRVAVVGTLSGGLGGSEYLAHIHGRVAGKPHPLDDEVHPRPLNAVRDLGSRGLLESAHDVSDGGLAVAIAEAAIMGPELIGVDVDIPLLQARADELFFGEAPARFVISYRRENQREVMDVAARHLATFRVIGNTGGSDILLRAGPITARIPVRRAAEAWRGGFSALAGA